MFVFIILVDLISIEMKNSSSYRALFGGFICKFYKWWLLQLFSNLVIHCVLSIHNRKNVQVHLLRKNNILNMQYCSQHRGIIYKYIYIYANISEKEICVLQYYSSSVHELWLKTDFNLTWNLLWWTIQTFFLIYIWR